MDKKTLEYIKQWESKKTHSAEFLIVKDLLKKYQGLENSIKKLDIKRGEIQADIKAEMLELAKKMHSIGETIHIIVHGSINVFSEEEFKLYKINNQL